MVDEQEIVSLMNQRIKSLLQIGNIIAVILTIIINGLAVILPLNNKTTQELSDAIPNLFVPAGITFSIWTIIYILLICFALYQARDLGKKEKQDMPFLHQIHGFFILASIGNILWIVLWHYEQVIFSLAAMFLLLVSLLRIYQRVHIGATKVSRTEKLCVHTPMSVYLGWITVATIANVTAVLVTVGWDGFGISEMLWTILVIIVAVLITILMLFKRNDIAYSLVVIWALLGIALKRFSDDPIYGVQPEIAYTAVGAILVLGLMILILAIRTSMKKIQSQTD
ncbi:MAG: tryptophan-rich sensory protein [Candidatus Thermoplasmatota archaeon]